MLFRFAHLTATGIVSRYRNATDPHRASLRRGTGLFVRGKGAALKSGMYSRPVRRGEYQRSMDVVQAGKV